MNIDMMPAGREMDALVAEKVMGIDPIVFKWCPHGARNPNVRPGFCESKDKLEGGVVVERHDTRCALRPYSTDIAAAWEVVEKLNIGFDVVRMREPITEVLGYSAQFYTLLNGPVGGGESVTAPLAICRAALKAVL